MAAGFRSPFFFGIGGGYAPEPVPTLTAWTLGALWTVSTICAKQGLYGLQRTADGVTSTSDVTATAALDVAPGDILYTAFWAKAGGGANGTISFGFAFYDSSGVLLLSSFVDSSGASTSWTQFIGNITVPPFAVSAIPIVRATGHTAGIWCVDTVYSVISGGNFSLSMLRHYHSPFVSYR